MEICSAPDKAEKASKPYAIMMGSSEMQSHHQELVNSLREWEARSLTRQEQMVTLIQKLHQDQLDDRSRCAKEQIAELLTALRDPAPSLLSTPPVTEGHAESHHWDQKEAAGFSESALFHVTDGLHKPGEEDHGNHGVLQESGSRISEDETEVLLHRDQLAKAVGWKSDSKNPSEVPQKMGTMFMIEKTKTGMGPLHKSLIKVVHSRTFDAATAIVVLANTFMIGFMVDLDLRRALANESPLSWENVCSLIFTCIFTVEVLMRLTADQKFFCKGDGKWWNLFDVIVILSGITEVLDVTDANLAPVRLLRLLRLCRILRIIRVFRFFRQLRMMALSMFACWGSLSWAFVLMFIVLYTFAIVLMEGAREYIRNDTHFRQDAVVENLRKWWSSLPRSLYTLSQVVTGGVSWSDPALPFDEMGAAYSFIFTLFVAFVLFGLLNVLVGIFVQSTSAIAEYDKEFVIQEEMAGKSSMMNQMRELFIEVDEDQSGTITWTELKANLDNDCVKAYFSLVQIDVHEAEGLFHLLDVDESGEVGIEEFIMGCMRLKGTAKSIDLATLLYENKRLHTLIRKFMNTMETSINTIHTKLNEQRGTRLPQRKPTC